MWAFRTARRPLECAPCRCRGRLKPYRHLPPASWENDAMDDLVRQAAKWPNVPDCRGWLEPGCAAATGSCRTTAQAAGPFAERLRGESRSSQLRHDKADQRFIPPGITRLIPKATGIFRNGPQRVLRRTQATPYIFQLGPDLQPRRTGVAAGVRPRGAAGRSGGTSPRDRSGLRAGAHAGHAACSGNRRSRAMWQPEDVSRARRCPPRASASVRSPAKAGARDPDRRRVADEHHSQRAEA